MFELELIAVQDVVSEQGHQHLNQSHGLRKENY